MSRTSAASSRSPPKPGGDDARALAERLTAPLESAIRLMLLDALSAAADEITRELAPGSVELRLRGGEPDFVVTPAPADEPAEPAPTARRPRRRTATRARRRASTSACPSSSRPASSRPPAASGCPSTPGSSGPPPPRSRTTTATAGRPAARRPDRPAAYTGWVHCMPTFDTPEPISATIDVVVGDVRISAGDRATTVVEVQPERRVQRRGRQGRRADPRRVRRRQLLVKAPKLRSWSAQEHRRVGRRDGRAARRLARARQRAAGGLPLRRPARRVPDQDRPRPHPARPGRHAEPQERHRRHRPSTGRPATPRSPPGRATCACASSTAAAVIKNSNGDTWVGAVARRAAAQRGQRQHRRRPGERRASSRSPPTATSGSARSCAARSCSRPRSATSRSASARAPPPGSTSSRPGKRPQRARRRRRPEPLGRDRRGARAHVASATS